MERKLRDLLDEKERILWYGRPTKGGLLRAPDGPLQCFFWVLCTFCTLFALFVFLPHAMRTQAHFGIILTVFTSVVCLPFGLACLPFLEQRLLEEKTVYAITDRRIIAIVEDKAMILPRTRQTRFSIHDRDKTIGSVCFNSAIDSSPYRRRANAILGFCKPGGHVHGLIFFRVSRPDVVAEILSCPA